MHNHSNNYVQGDIQTIIFPSDLQFFWKRKIKMRKKNVNNDFGLQICISSFGTATLTSFANFLCGYGGS